MRQNSRYFENINYINFTPLKLKVNKTEFFSIQTNQDNNNRHKSSSNLNNKVKNHPLIRNPTHNFLYDKININILSNSKFLLNKTILKENQNFCTNKNSKSVDCALKKFRKKENNKNIYNIGNSIKLDNDNFLNFYDKVKKPTKTLYIYSDLVSQNKYNQYNKLSNYNSNSVPIYTVPKNYNHEDKKKFIIINGKENIKKYNKLNKIILIQSYWRSYYLRKLVVGGLEKYYSSIAMSKYLNNVLFQNKKYLFHYFIELIKEYIITNKFSCFKYKRNKNNINIFFKNKDDDTNGSFEIPLDKKNDCIYFFIKREQTKSNKNKPSDNNNNNDINLFNDNKDININGYNWKSNKKSRNIKKNKLNCLNNEDCNKVNIKINLINNNNLENNKKIKRFESDLAINGNKNRHKIKSIDLYKNPPIKARHKKIYTKKRIGEENSKKNNNRNIFLKRFIPSFINQVSDSNIINNRIKENKKEINANKLYSVVKVIKKKYFLLYYPILIKKLKLENSKKTRNDFQLHNLFPKRNITYYKKKNNKFNYAKLKLKSDNKNEFNKIKVNKNNKIEKHKKYKLIKKIMEKKINKINKRNIICLTKYFLFWKNFFKITFIHFHLNEKLKLNNTQQTDLSRYKSEHTSPKKHIKFRFKKSFNTLETICSSNSERKKNSSMSCKKMKIFKKYSDRKHLFSTFSNDINSNCKRNLFTQIKKKHDFYDKIISLIKKLENKSMKNKYFTYWKKKK